jgi:transcriptional regulator with XRE-family HTH domain
MVRSPSIRPGARLRHARKQAGLSTAELGKLAAEVLGRPKPISASAVRNQENGTNGIPYSLLEAYAKALNRDVWDIFFPAEAPSDRPELPGDDLGVNVENIYVPILGEVSGGWEEVVLGVGLKGRKDAVLFTSDLVDGRYLGAFEVRDDTLEPLYSKGDIVIAADASSIPIMDGDHVVATSFVGKIAVVSVRRLTCLGEKLLLLPIGARSQAPIELVSGEVPLIDAVIIAKIHWFSRSQEPIHVPKEFFSNDGATE